MARNAGVPAAAHATAQASTSAGRIEALNRLIYEGLVVPTPYHGYVAAPLTLESIRELCDIRRINEAAAAALGAERLTDADLDRLEQVAEPHYVAGDRTSYATYLRTNASFHLAVVRCTRNGRLQAIVMAAIDQLQRPEYLGLGLGTKDSRQVASEHLAIVEALRSRDPARAQALMSAHISQAEARMTNALQASDFWNTPASHSAREPSSPPGDGRDRWPSIPPAAAKDAPHARTRKRG